MPKILVDVTVLGLVGGTSGGETPRVADSSAGPKIDLACKTLASSRGRVQRALYIISGLCQQITDAGETSRPTGTDAGLFLHFLDRYGPAAAALQPCPKTANATQSRCGRVRNAHMQLPLLRRSVSEQKRAVPAPARKRRLLRRRSSGGPARARSNSGEKTTRRDVSCWLWCRARCGRRGSAHIAL